MKFLQFVLLHVVLLPLSHGRHLRFIKPNVLALEVELMKHPRSNVHLHCGSQYDDIDKEIRWERNGSPIAMSGNNINVTVTEMHGGNFSCLNRATGHYLNHTLVLVKPINYTRMVLDRSHDPEHITCESRNYSGQFHCNWKWNPNRNGVVVLYKAMRSSVPLSCHLESSGLGLTCEDPLQCPYAEEADQIEVSLLVRNSYRLEEYRRHFFLFQIVKPEKVHIIKAEDGEFEWENPKTWNTPCPYFPLHFQVKVVELEEKCGHDGLLTQTTTETSFKLPDDSDFQDGYKFCVRAQDQLTNRAWSEWSHHSVD